MASKTMTLDRVLDLSEQLPATDQLRLINLLSERLLHTLTPASEPVDILSTAGLGADLWRGIDVDAYLEEERASWER
jgi:hypothetical protein